MWRNMGERGSRFGSPGPVLIALAVGIGGAWIIQQGVVERRERERDARTEGAALESQDPPAEAAAGAPAAEAPPVEPGAPPSSPETAAGAEEGSAPPAEPVPAAPEAGPVIPETGKLPFREVWSYILPGEQKYLEPGKPITDIGLFDFNLDHAGRLVGKANTAGIERAAALGIRKHLVVASSGNKSLLHLTVSPRGGVREKLIDDIARLPRRHAVDGVQLDLEGPSPEDRADLVSFIRALRAALPAGCLLSLALPAKKADDPAGYVYADLKGLADRFFIMVYDLHWKGGPPGPISDLAWHDAVLACAASKLPIDAVVIGLPFYGRVWQIEEVARAVTHPQAADLAARTSSEIRRDPAKTHSFRFREEVTAECWFEDAATTRAKLEIALRRGFRNIGFWRLGQEDPQVWEAIGREPPAGAPADRR
jgi:spore germination protein